MSQLSTRNPLASPDIIGFSTGAYTGALVVIILLGGSYLQVAGGALADGIGAAALVYLLAYRRGVQGFRLIVVGIAVSAMLTSVNTYLLLVCEHDVAISAAVWGAGTLNATTWEQAAPSAAVIALAARRRVAQATMTTSTRTPADRDGSTRLHLDSRRSATTSGSSAKL